MWACAVHAIEMWNSYNFLPITIAWDSWSLWAHSTAQFCSISSHIADVFKPKQTNSIFDWWYSIRFPFVWIQKSNFYIILFNLYVKTVSKLIEAYTKHRIMDGILWKYIHVQLYQRKLQPRTEARDILLDTLWKTTNWPRFMARRERSILLLWYCSNSDRPLIKEK
jgi:hypothetical protein